MLDCPPRRRGLDILEFLILGPLEVRRDGRPLGLGGPRQRSVLALLVTHANQVLSTDRLIDDVWSGSAPDTAANALQGYVSQLRKLLGEDVIRTRAPGYVAVLAADALDLHRFERLAEEGRRALEAGDPATAATALRDALALWRGPPLADVAMEPFAQAEIARLEDLRGAVLERRIEADLACGRHADVVGELEALVARHPYRERLHAHLMLALYRSGRQADAVTAYRRAREALVEGLGLEPSPSLSALEVAILRQDPALELPGPAPAAAPSGEIPEGSVLVAPSYDDAGALLALAERLVRWPFRELVLARLVATGADLDAAAAAAGAARDALVSRGVPVRAAAFTSQSVGEDLVILAAEQEADLLLLDAPGELLASGRPGPDLATVLLEAACDVALLAPRERAEVQAGADRPVVVPFGGVEHEWAAVEIGAWVARAYGARLRLVGTAAGPGDGRRDASRLLARAALMVQRVAAVPAEPQLVPAGASGVLAAADHAGLVVVGLSSRWRAEGLGPARHAVLRDAAAPCLLVRRGPRPGGLAPRETLTRFTWTLGGTGG
ncbi:MAG TPA: BTAD domain-containing putative transcriptional regulator [Thermoleophilaceae bacterium]|nr:BTAD domain-containing putative transcriptional regulator [Thermoleophilaceae bacterium]